jgi:hypothetical protein
MLGSMCLIELGPFNPALVAMVEEHRLVLGSMGPSIVLGQRTTVIPASAHDLQPLTASGAQHNPRSQHALCARIQALTSWGFQTHGYQ